MGSTVRLLLLLCLALAGCVTSAPVDNPRKVWCDNNKPMRPSAAVFAVMTRPDLDDMNTHNARGVKWCGWRP
ncbi:hypothetical protein EJ070_26360 [Mesorhizobium sp. M1E.F.Ca.ET.045.02.1.1]|uniref:hypothetical protein n=1 Tax=Mesorhizobium sp. M1E.F.Ca.ET.045.02.1.1 TaxID=2493672 RepID=UPI000F75A6BB|nr:hypothetical protein [Mesorhizobium sp. M1E.F.Ca.ET.045.02.1.1]AZO23857.1 hypothetical protein EJ070_26360 [Mesorhizobium sp. M1E.F.Ca.ET.045.02.1.1]